MLINLPDAQRIVRENDGFKTSVVEIDGHTVHDFGYRLPGYMDFMDPIPGSGLNALEMRGLTFVEKPNGEVERYLMLPKFHALNQTQGHMLKDVRGKRIVSCTEKLDGSLARFIPIGEETYARTKTSFNGPHAELANKLFQRDANLRDFVWNCHACDIAPIFELLAPSVQTIVIEYPEDRLRLIQMRNEVTGEIIDMTTNDDVETYGIETAEVPGITSIDDLIDLQRTERNVEGWVVRFEDGQLMKVKTTWFDDMHDFTFEKNNSMKKLVQLVANETFDDAISRLPDDYPGRDGFEASAAKVSAFINHVTRKVTDTVEANSGPLFDGDARKAFVAEHKGDPLISLYMQAFKDPTPDTVTRLVKAYVTGQAKKEADAEAFVSKLPDAEDNTSAFRAA